MSSNFEMRVPPSRSPEVAIQKFAYIDALRGFAVMGVLVHHAYRNIELKGAMGDNQDLNYWLHIFGAAGARGVQLFFVVSALTLLLS